MDYPTYLIHYGIEGQKWGVRRFQNEDGTLTEEGIRRYGKLLDKSEKSERYKKKLSKFENKIGVERFDTKNHDKMHEYRINAADRRQRGKDPTHYVKKYANTSLETANKFVNGNESEAAQKIVQHYVDMSMNGLNYVMWEIGDFNSYNDHPTKYNQIDYSYNTKTKKISQKKWKSDWN